MATITSAGSGKWSATATWVGGAVPADGDSVVIATSHNVEFDVDQSGFATGLAGLVITGTLTLSTTAGTYYLKMAGNVTGVGSLVGGSESVPYPVACTFTELLNGNFSNQLSASGAYQLFCAEPTIATVRLTANEPSGETVLAIDTDISALTDYWKTGALLRVDNVDQGVDTEENTFASATSNTITLGTPLNSAVITGTLVHLISRNIKIIGVSVGSTAQGAINGGLNGQIRVEVRLLNQAFLGTGIGHTIAGTISGCTNGFISGTAHELSGIISGCSNALAYGIGYTIAGTISGCANGLLLGTRHIVSAMIAGCTNGVNTSSGHIVAGTILGCVNGITLGMGQILMSSIFSGNTRDISGTDITVWYGQGCSLNSGIQVSAIGINLHGLIGVFIEDIQGVAGAWKSWQWGGTVTTVTSLYPTGFTQSYQHALANTSPCFWERQVLINAGETLRFTGYFRKDASQTYLPRLQLFEKGADPIASATFILLEKIMTDAIDTWEDYDLSYTNDTAFAKNYVIRFTAEGASGNVYTQLAVTDPYTTLQTDITAIKAKTDQMVFTIANQVDANALTGGTSASAIRIEMDANSTKLADILADTGTTLPATLTTIDGIVDDILVDTGTTLPAQLNTIRGADSDTLETLSDQMDALASGSSIATINTSIIGLQSYIASNLDDDITKGTIIKTRGDTWNIPISNIGSLVGNKNIWFTMKLMTALQDEQCTLQVAKTEGLLILNGASGSIVASSGSIIILDETVGNIMIKVTPNITKQIMSSDQYSYDAQTLDANDDVLTVEKGSFEVTADTTRRIV